MSDPGYIGTVRDNTDYTLAGQRQGAEARSTVPEGTRADVLAWVGQDRERARQALEAERAGRGRSTLIADLEALV